MHTPSGLHGASQQRGYALILAMVALVSLTFLGVTAISVAQMDMKITSNLRHHRQVAYGALAGLDQARDRFSDNLVDASASIELAADQANDCITGWIGTSTTAVAAPLLLEANGFGLATYTVNFCVATCGDPLAGNSLGEGVVGYTIDIVATGSSPPRTGATVAGSSSIQSQGAFVYGQMEEASCE